MNFRIGYGYDVHRLAEGEELWLGGILIPFEKGTVAHSDGDVLIHALCDALLGAAGLRDIGYYFPDNSEEFKNISSLILLEKTVQLIRAEGFIIGNADVTVCIQKPKLMDFIPEMKNKLAAGMGVEINQVSVKATTTEKLGFVGSGEGISAHAVALIEKAEFIND
ncbi:MAG: 2-C-methyl-D-erythritol 2,4-cyclodiphosphate synthase [Prolixibacteraceae bacterium]|nr:2-C-methyl-D-erythritol 2,4-cyclodiphosphate synthase [Prolixibacteraceae bacterium]